MGAQMAAVYYTLDRGTIEQQLGVHRFLLAVGEASTFGDALSRVGGGAWKAQFGRRVAGHVDFETRWRRSGSYVARERRDGDGSMFQATQLGLHREVGPGGSSLVDTHDSPDNTGNRTSAPLMGVGARVPRFACLRMRRMAW